MELTKNKIYVSEIDGNGLKCVASWPEIHGHVFESDVLESRWNPTILRRGGNSSTSYTSLVITLIVAFIVVALVVLKVLHSKGKLDNFACFKSSESENEFFQADENMEKAHMVAVKASEA